jgi:hypothetical protein
MPSAAGKPGGGLMLSQLERGESQLHFRCERLGGPLGGPLRGLHNQRSEGFIAVHPQLGEGQVEGSDRTFDPVPRLRERQLPV